jgi:hypothetical protein
VNVVGRIIVAREALEVGDTSLAYDVLVDLEADLTVVDLPERRLPCSACGTTFRWPGELDHHLYATGHRAAVSA